MRGVRLTERISVVGGSATGLGISHTLDPNVYLLSGGEELALVDAGAGPGEDRILENVRSLGYEPGQIGHIFLTHAHADRPAEWLLPRGLPAPSLQGGCGTSGR